MIAASAVFYGTPLLYAALGELLAERSGVLNLGVEGMMLMGAVDGLLASCTARRPGALALVRGGRSSRRVAGAVDRALIHAFLVITLRASQIVSGLALTIFAGAAGLSSYLANDLNLAESPARHAFSPVLPRACRICPSSARSCSTRTRSSTLSWVVTLAVALYLARTRPGLDAAGRRRVARRGRRDRHQRLGYRYVHTLVGGALAGVGGACFSLSITPQWARRADGRRRLDRDRARHLRVLAARPLSRRRVPVRRVLRPRRSRCRRAASRSRPSCSTRSPT